MKVGYHYLKGTNIEVGVRRVSRGGKFAIITYRYGKHKYMHTHKWKAARKRQEASKHMEAVVPSTCLAKKSAWTKRGLFKKKFKPDIPLTEVDMAKDLYICGAIKAPLKSYDELTGVVTFATTPVRKAHISVLTNTKLQHVFDKRTSLAGDASPVEYGCIQGTNIHVKMLIEEPGISLYRFGKDVAWIPHELVDSNPTVPSHVVTNAIAVGKKYLHGFLPVDAYNTEFDDVLIRLPGKNIAESWSKKEHIYDQPTKPYMLTYKQDVKNAYIVDQQARLINMRPVV